MEILEITRGHIIIKDKDRLCTVLGEGLLLNEYNDISYVIYANSIKKWNKPFENIEVTTDEKNDILKFIIDDFKNRNQKVDIE